MRVPSLVMVVTTATPVGKRPSASLKLRSVNVIVLSLDALASRWLNCGTTVGSCPYLLTGYREARDLEHFAKWLSQKLRRHARTWSDLVRASTSFVPQIKTWMAGTRVPAAQARRGPGPAMTLEIAST